MPAMLRKWLASKPLWSALALLLLLGGATSARLAFSQSDDAAQAAGTAGATPDQSSLLARGKYLTQAADCMPCHTGPGHAPFTGGLVMNTPFGGLPTPNITPDRKTGIGNWTPRQFYNAVHDGIAPGSAYLVFPRYLYPAMPFTSYTKLSYDDIMAIRAYLMSLAPVQAAPLPNSLAFPFNQRPSLLGWRILFFTPGPMHMDPGWSADVKNGAYLTEAWAIAANATPRATPWAR